jgi:DNA-binding transcriptional regulator GbsR (MarR family)
LFKGCGMSVRTNGKEQSTDALLSGVHDSMLDGLGQLSDYFGFNKVMGQLYGAILLSDRPVCLDDLVERLDISKANVSINIRTLENMGMVRQVWVRGSGGRRKFYEAETDFWTIITNILKGREMRDVDRALAVMNDNLQRLQNAMPAMSEADQQVAQVYVERILQMQGLFQFAQMMIMAILAKVAEGEGDEIVKGLTGNLPL